MLKQLDPGLRRDDHTFAYHRHPGEGRDPERDTEA